MSKQISLAEGARLIKSGMMIALGGMTLYRRPVSFTKALIKHYFENHTPTQLTLLTFTAGIESDLLIGSKMVSTIRTCYFGLEVFGTAPIFTHLANKGEINILEETEASISAGLRAKMAGIGFMPAKAWLGTDLPLLRKDVKTIQDPYSGETLMAFPAISPDVAIIHAIKSDKEGNALIGKNKGIDEELALASITTIITTEEIVPELKQADIVAPLVDAVIHAPNGAKPTSCHPLYPVDSLAILDYIDKVSNLDSWETYIRDNLRIY